MKVLVICSFKKGLHENMAPFVHEQVEALRHQGLICGVFLVRGKGFSGYLKQFKPLKTRIESFNPDVIHAHFGLCGLLANLQRQVPVVTTYHGSDINDKKVLPFSKWAMRLSAWNIFVSRKTVEIAKPKKNYSLLPCGIDLTELQLTEKSEARKRMHLAGSKKYVLFAGTFDNAVKNAALAKEAVTLLRDDNVELLELKGYIRDEVTLMMCAADAFLMTSITEGSPQVIKEALSCGCPIVSVDVGDVKERIESVDGCFVTQTREPQELAGLLEKAVMFEGNTKGREKVIADGLDNRQVAEKLLRIYNEVTVK